MKKYFFFKVFFLGMHFLVHSAEVNYEFRIFDAIKNDDLLNVISIIEKNRNIVDVRSQEVTHPSIPIDLSPLDYACLLKREEVVKILLNAGASQESNSKGLTPLMLAILPNEKKFDVKEIVKMLLEKKPNINQATIDFIKIDGKDIFQGTTALMLAAMYDLTLVALELIGAGANIDVQNRHGLTPLMLAIISKNAYLARNLINKNANINKRNTDGDTALTLAAFFGLQTIVELLLKKGVDKNAFDNNGYTALMKAVLGNRQPISIVQALIDVKVDIDLRDKEGNTALILACIDGKKEVVKLLLEASANKNSANKYGFTPLMEAVARNYKEIVKLLLEHGVDINLKNNKGETAVEIAKKSNNNDIVSIIMSFSKQPFDTQVFTRSLQILERCLTNIQKNLSY